MRIKGKIMKKLLFLVGIASLGLTFALEKPETPDIDRESQDLAR